MVRVVGMIAGVGIGLGMMVGCEELAAPRDVSGNFDVSYVDNLRVYFGDDLVAEVTAGEDAEIEWNGEILQVSQVCGKEGVDCPGETFWGSVGIEQPWGTGRQLLNFVNLDQERGQPGQRMGGALNNDGTFTMLAGVAVDGNKYCAALGVAAVEGRFGLLNTTIADGVIAYEFNGGCQFGKVEVGVKVRLETDYTATRVGDLDLSTVTPEPPIDEEGEEVGTTPSTP